MSYGLLPHLTNGIYVNASNAKPDKIDVVLGIWQYFGSEASGRHIAEFISLMRHTNSSGVGCQYFGTF